VDLPDLGRKPGREALEDGFPELKDRRWVVFMSRLHPKKGVDVLLRAWARQNVEQGAWGMERGEGESRRGERPKDQEPERSRTANSPKANGAMLSRGQTKDLPVLILAGSDLIGYRKDVEKMVRDLGLEDSVVVTGEVQGEMKDALLANADVFVLPSYSENFGIVVAEAMSWGRPVITSTGTPWKEVAEVGAGWWVAPEEDTLAKALAEELGQRPRELEAMGAKGRALVEERYTWVAPAERLVRAYERILATAGAQRRQREA
jgi:glycosyltransferase involved in cell wall biosynthesis